MIIRLYLYIFFEKDHIPVAGSFSVYSIRRNMIKFYPLLAVIQPDNLVKMASASFLHYKITVFSTKSILWQDACRVELGSFGTM